MRAELRGPQAATGSPNDLVTRELCAMRRGVEALLMVNQAMANIMWKGLLPLISDANARGEELLRARDDLVAAKDRIEEVAREVADALREAR